MWFVLNPQDPAQAAMMAVIRLVYDDVSYHEAPCLVFRRTGSYSMEYKFNLLENHKSCVVIIINSGIFHSNELCIY